MRPKENKRAPFLIGLSYLASFIFIRLLVIIIGSAGSEVAQIVSEGNNQIRFYIGRNVILFGYHIHHFYFGVLFMAIAGWLAIVGSPKVNTEKLALLFGAGLGLFMDEIGLLLTWGDYYSSLSYLLGVLTLGIILNVVYFPQFWRNIRNQVVKLTPTPKPLKKTFKLFVNIADILSMKRTNKGEDT